MTPKLFFSLLLLLFLALPLQDVFASENISTTGATTTKYIFAGDMLVATIEGSGSTSSVTTTNVVHTDHLGGTHAISSATGTVVQALDYYPYGSERINTKQTGFDEKRKFTGHEHDNATGLNYMMARYQNSNRGQFLSQDLVFWEVGNTDDGKKVLTNPQLQNSYSYAGNNPITQKDPDGRFVPQAVVLVGIIPRTPDWNFLYLVIPRKLISALCFGAVKPKAALAQRSVDIPGYPHFTSLFFLVACEFST